MLRDTLVGLARDLVAGTPAPAPYAYDPNDGVHPTAAAYGSGPSTATAGEQPLETFRLGHAAFSWHGGANGIDRPVDAPFVTIQRALGHRWVTQTNDLGMQILWSSDASGDDTARWEVPLTAAPGLYRFLITGKLLPAHLGGVRGGRGRDPDPADRRRRSSAGYPDPPSWYLEDWTYRPPDARVGASPISSTDAVGSRGPRARRPFRSRRGPAW